MIAPIRVVQKLYVPLFSPCLNKFIVNDIVNKTIIITCGALIYSSSSIIQFVIKPDQILINIARSISKNINVMCSLPITLGIDVKNNKNK